MGLYPVDCVVCKKPFLWFSSNHPQLCEDCRLSAKATELQHLDPRDFKPLDGEPEIPKPPTGTAEAISFMMEHEFKKPPVPWVRLSQEEYDQKFFATKPPTKLPPSFSLLDKKSEPTDKPIVYYTLRSGTGPIPLTMRQKLSSRCLDIHEWLKYEAGLDWLSPFGWLASKFLNIEDCLGRRKLNWFLRWLDKL